MLLPLLPLKCLWLNINISSHVERIERINPTKVIITETIIKIPVQRIHFHSSAVIIKSGVHRMKEIPLCGQQVAPSYHPPRQFSLRSIKPTTPVLPWIIKHRFWRLSRLPQESSRLMDSCIKQGGRGGEYYPDHATDSLAAVRETRIRSLIQSWRSR